MPTKVRFAGVNHTQLPQIVSDGIALKGLSQTAGYPDGYGDLADAVNKLTSAMSAARVIKTAAIGDSRLANSVQDQTAGGITRLNWSNQGVIYWLNMFLNQRLDIRAENVFAVSGSTTSQILLQVPSAISSGCKICFINGGTNDLSASGTIATADAAFNNLTSAASQLVEAGILPVIECDMPRTAASWTANTSKLSAYLNRKLRVWCKEVGIPFADFEARYVKADGDPQTGYNVADGIHQSCTGAVVRANAYAAALQDYLTPYTLKTGTPLDVYDASFFPSGNLLSVGLMLGTGGTNTGTGASGSVSTGWQNRIVSGTGTAVASKESPRTDGALGDRLVVALSATTAITYRLSPANIVTTGKLVSGDQVCAEMDFEITALAGSIDYIRLFLQDFDGVMAGSTSVTGKDVFATGLNPLPLVPLPNNTGSGNLYTTLSGRIKTEVVVIGQTITSTELILRLEAGLNVGASCTFKIGDVVIRKLGS
jgi:hypothetical protein